MEVPIKEHKEIINLLGGGKKLTARLKVLTNESINENKFFAVGQKDQWKSELEQNQIKIIENKFGLMMKKLKYKLFN